MNLYALERPPMPKSSGPVPLRAPRQAFQDDVFQSDLSRNARQTWGALCEHQNRRQYTGVVWPKVDTLAKEMGVSIRTVQRGLSELKKANWIGTPCGSQGGASNGTQYHLHPDQKPCMFCQAAARTLDRSSSLKPAPGVTSCHPLEPRGVTKTTSRGDKNDIAYKEEQFIRTSHTPEKSKTEQELERVAARLHSNHPRVRRDIGIGQISKLLRIILSRKKLKAVAAIAYLGELAERHEAWCKSEQWQRDGGTYAKSLENWLCASKERYDVPAPLSDQQKNSSAIAPRGLKAGEIE